jgi:3-oxoacyl-[acyl-carrier protein] reductase
MRPAFEGRVALVTGASEGIGAEVALELARQGADLAICSRTQDTLLASAERIRAATGRRVEAIVADLAHLEGCKHFVAQAVTRLSRVDILVNNAGSSRMMPFAEMPDEVFVDAFEGKLFAAARCCREVIPPMRAAGGGVIINITGATQQGVALHAAGGSANAALRMLTKVWSLEFAPWNIRVNSIAPGRIRTDRLDRMVAAEARAAGIEASEMTARMTSSIPSGRLGEPKDVAGLVCFLASDASAYINGTSITIDGGKSPLI